MGLLLANYDRGRLPLFIRAAPDRLARRSDNTFLRAAKFNAVRNLTEVESHEPSGELRMAAPSASSISFSTPCHCATWKSEKTDGINSLMGRTVRNTAQSGAHALKFAYQSPYSSPHGAEKTAQLPHMES